MTIPSIPAPSNLFLLPSPATVSSASGVAATLRPEQLVRALVVAAEARDELLLEIGKERFRPVGNRPLQAGQVLELHIIQTTPRLEAMVMNNRLQEQLAVRLPVLAQPFDWSRLLERLQLPEIQQQLRPTDQVLANQLRQLIDAGQGRFSPLREQVDQLVAQLRAFRQEGEILAVSPAPSQFTAAPAANFPALVASVEQSRQIAQLLGRLQAQLVPLIELGGETMSKDWQVTTTEVLAQLRQYADTRSLPALQAPEWIQALQLLRHHPGVTEQIARQATTLLAQLPMSKGWQIAPGEDYAQFRQYVDAHSPPAPRVPDWTQTQQLLRHHAEMAEQIARQATTLPAQLKPSQSAALVEMLSSGSLAPGSASGPVVATQLPQLEMYKALQPLLQELKTLLGMGSDAPRSAPAQNLLLTPDLLGRIDGLSTQIHQLMTREGIVPLLQQGLQLVAVQLQRLALTPPIPARGESLGVLSQLFGLHLERELLLGKQKQALTNLKQALLTLQQKSSEDFREPLNRIELFQLCKARFSESQLHFLPLPQVGLGDGYLLAGRHDAEKQDDPARKPKEEVQLSLLLRLSSLGSMRVDLTLLPDQGLVVRLACEDRHKMEYVKGCEEELVDALAQMALRQIHYSADARHPLKQLLQSLLPQQNNLLDTRA